jgi:hypothetical protein
VLRIECTRCERKGRYLLPKIILQYGRMASMMARKSSSPVTAKRNAPRLHDRCDLICPDLPKVV